MVRCGTKKTSSTSSIHCPQLVLCCHQPQRPNFSPIYTPPHHGCQAMCTNIHLGHALPVLTHFLYETKKGQQIVRDSDIFPAALLTALELVMNNNIFSFGDTLWLQTAGTAMGTPPAPTWATIYFCIWEIVIIPEFPELMYYRQYIDDEFGAWVPNSLNDNSARLTIFHQRMQSYGIEHEFFLSNPDLCPLQWTFSVLVPTAVFLDLSISIDNGRVSTKIYEKIFISTFHPIPVI